jgi:hypothetical protein
VQTPTARQIALGFVGARLAFGATALLAPSLAGRSFGARSDDTRYVTRSFGVREIVLGVHLLGCLDDPVRLRRAVALNAAVDGGDLLAALAERKLQIVLVAGGAVAAWASAWRQLAPT